MNELKLNHDKTEIMLIHSKYHTRPFFSYFSMGNEKLTTTAKARSLGLVIDDNMIFDVISRTFADHRFTSLGTYQR